MRLLLKTETQPKTGMDFAFNNYCVLWVRVNEDGSIRKLTIWYK